jgi:hypothetical protein
METVGGGPFRSWNHIAAAADFHDRVKLFINAVNNFTH